MVRSCQCLWGFRLRDVGWCAGCTIENVSGSGRRSFCVSDVEASLRHLFIVSQFPSCVMETAEDGGAHASGQARVCPGRVRGDELGSLLVGQVRTVSVNATYVHACVN